MNDYESRIRQEARGAIARLVKAAGGKITRRPVRWSEPQGMTTPEPEALAGITAAAALEREYRRQCLEYVRFAREDGHGWHAIGEALGLAAPPLGGMTSVAEHAYLYATRGPYGWFLWTCPACGQHIRDYGPGIGNPYEAEQGHAEGCERFAAALEAYEEAENEDTGGSGTLWPCMTSR